ncbi:hypothetical protein K9U39_01990 [Rhodoblastus acidophilus]|nr:hypothetical protein [Rhodoblastus acidophilus]
MGENAQANLVRNAKPRPDARFFFKRFARVAADRKNGAPNLAATAQKHDFLGKARAPP